MNFLKTIFPKYDLSVNSEKLSEKTLTRLIFCDIIFLGGARCLPHFLFYCLLFATKKREGLHIKVSPRLRIPECQGEFFLFIISYKADEVSKHLVGIKFNFTLCERIDQKAVANVGVQIALYALLHAIAFRGELTGKVFFHYFFHIKGLRAYLQEQKEYSLEMLRYGFVKIICVEHYIELMMIVYNERRDHIIAHSCSRRLYPIEDLIFINVMTIKGGTINTGHSYYIRRSYFMEILLFSKLEKCLLYRFICSFIYFRTLFILHFSSKCDKLSQTVSCFIL